MPTYDFDKLTLRRNTNSVKWDEATDAQVIPLWVADMDFEAAPCITKALQQRVAHGIFGYTLVPDSYYVSIINWFKRRHQWNIKRQWIIYTTGVVPAISAIVKAMTKPGDKVVIQTPVYNCFFSSIRNNGCEIVESPLVVDYSHEDAPTYQIDYDDLERKVSDPAVKLFILCNPHNPAGRVWKRDELERMNDICMKHGVKVLSDEIHCELTIGNHKFTPFASISKECQDNSITCNSPSKSFNIAGLQIANIISNDEETRKKIDRAINDNEICDVNPFGVVALQAAYNEGEPWLLELNQYLEENYKTLRTFFKQRLPHLKVFQLEGTYLVWVDITATGKSADEVTHLLLKEGKVMVNSGTMYGKTAGEGFIRINIACPRSRMMEGLERIANVLQ